MSENNLHPLVSALEMQGDKPLCYACANGLTGTTKTCHACANGLIGKLKDDDFHEFDDIEYECEPAVWECWCTEWYCRCDETSKCAYDFWCPICESWDKQSRYLREVFADPKIRWLANMVTHYRHDHRNWEAQHKFISANRGEGVYDAEKSKVNEQAKRQIIRKATPFLKEHGIGPEHFAALQGTEEKTLLLARKNLT